MTVRRSWLLAEMRGEPVELVFPEAAIGIEPVRGIAHRGRCQSHAPHPSVAPPFHQARPLEHDEVFADRGERHREGARQLADGGLARGEPRDDRAARRIGERAEYGVEARC